MKTALYLVVVIAALAYAEEVLEETHAIEAANTDAVEGDGLPGDIQQAVAGDLNLKVVVEDDGTPRGKCYCSCNLNDQPVFMEFDPNYLLANYGLESDL